MASQGQGGLGRVRSGGFLFFGVYVLGFAGVCSLVCCGAVGRACDGEGVVLWVLYHGFGGVFLRDLGIFLMREVGSQGRWGQVRFEFTFFSG